MSDSGCERDRRCEGHAAKRTSPCRGDQAVSSLDVSPDQVVSVQIFGSDIQGVSSLSARIEYDSTQVVYEGFDAGDVLPDAQALVEQDSISVWIGIASLSGSTVNAGLVGTLRFRTTDVFSELEALKQLYLEGNPVDPLPITVSLERAGAGQFKAKAHTGAPFDIVLPISIANGTIDGGTSRITIHRGRVESDVFRVSRTAGTTSAVSVDIEQLPTPHTVFHQGYTLVKSTADLPLVVLE